VIKTGNIKGAYSDCPLNGGKGEFPLERDDDGIAQQGTENDLLGDQTYGCGPEKNRRVKRNGYCAAMRVWETDCCQDKPPESRENREEK